MIETKKVFVYDKINDERGKNVFLSNSHPRRILGVDFTFAW
jgi:hypothetical protein